MRSRGRANIVPVDQHAGATSRAHRYRDRGRSHAGEHAEHRRPSDPPPHICQVTKRGDLVDVGPAPVELEDHLARLASKHDLELPPTDGGGVPTAYRTRRRLILERTRKGVHFYL